MPPGKARRRETGGRPRPVRATSRLRGALLHERVAGDLRMPPVDTWGHLPILDILPPTPQEVWDANVAAVVRALS